MRGFELYDLKEFGYMLYRERIKKGYSQKDFAMKIGINHTYLCRIEAGSNKKISPDQLMKVAKILNMEIKLCVIR